MALRRVLPSRQTGATSPDSSTAPTPQQTASVIATPVSVPVPVEAPPAPEPVKASQAEIAAVASSAFSTLPTAPVAAPAMETSLPVAPARVLEDSFAPAALPQPVIPSVADFQPAAAPTVYEASAPTAPQQAEPAQAAEVAIKQEPIAPAASPAQPAVIPSVAATPAGPAAAPSRPDENRFKRQVGNNNNGRNNNRKPPRVDGQRNETPRTETNPSPAPTPAAEPAVDAAAALVDQFLAEEVANAPVTAPTQIISASQALPSVEEPTPTPSSSSPQTSTEPRRNRVKRERDFAAATVAAPAAPAPSRPSSGTAALAQNVPVNTRPLDRVDEELIASGIIAAPPGDSLTSNVPVSLAAAEDHFDPAEPEISPVREEEPPRAESQPFLSSLPTPAAIPSAPATLPLPNPTSDLPWANNSGGNSGWEVELPATPAESTPITAAPPPGDFFKPVAGGSAASAPAWASGANRQGVPAPELPGARGIKGPSMGRGGTPVWGIGVAGLAVAIVAFFLWNSSGGQQNQLQEKVARWTGSLKENTENLPPELGGNTGTAGQNLVKPEGTFSMSDFHTNPNGTAGALLPPPATVTADNTPPPAAQVSSTAQIAFTDVPADQAAKPIVADGSEKMPEDVSLFAKFQQAVAEARAEKQAGVSGTTPAKQVAAADNGPLTPEKLKEELSAYRKSLVDTAPAQPAPNPTSFNKDPAAYMDGKSALDASGAPAGTLQPPPATAAESAKGAAGPNNGMLPPPDLYTNNPNHLPIVGEPVANAPARVRTLADFEVEPFSPETPKVRIPRMVKPKLAATDFPTLQVLSFVQGKGIIASVGGREGVLLIGETMEGWELTNVTPELAEFRAGQRRHYITVND